MQRTFFVNSLAAFIVGGTILPLAALADGKQALRLQPLQAARLIVARGFAHFESCERIPVQVEGVSGGTLRRISLEVYRSRQNVGVGGREQMGSVARARRASVLILPPSGGFTLLERGYAEQLCQRGIDGWALREWNAGQSDYANTFDPLAFDAAAANAVQAVRTLVRLMGGQVAVMGTSAGAVIAALATAIEPQVRGAVFIAGGADLADVLTNSQAPYIAKERHERMAAWGVGPREYVRFIRSRIQLDPAFFAAGFKGKFVGSIVSTGDKTIPLRNQIRLERVSGAKRIATSNLDHSGAIILTGLIDSWKIVDFFERHLSHQSF